MINEAMGGVVGETVSKGHEIKEARGYRATTA